MVKAIYYKEWIKTRVYFPVAVLITLGMTVFTVMKIARVAAMQGVAHLWEILITREVVFIENLQYLPAALGLTLALVQFVPETAQKKLKLTLHLPYPRIRMVLHMLLYGIVMLAVMLGLQYGILYGYLHSVLAPELTARILLTALPWIVCGVNLYLLTAWVCLEPAWKRRLVNALIAVGVTSVYFLTPQPQAYDSFVPVLCLATLCCMLFPLASVERFKRGVQD